MSAPTRIAHGSAPTRRPAPLARHSLVLARRSLAKSLRNPGSLVNGVMTPAIFMVLFVYLFGGSVAGSTDAYLQYLFPGVLVMGAGIAGMLSSGLTINIDMKKGVYDRFRSLPIGRSAPLLGSVLADLVRYVITVLILFAIGFLMGFRIETDLASAVAASALAIAFGFGLSWVMVFLGVLLRDESAVMAITFIAILPLLLGTSMAAPVDTLPGWLQTWAGINPVTHAMDAARALLTGAPMGDAATLTLAWSAGLVAVFAPLAVWAFNRER